jgi:hypothetical protein
MTGTVKFILASRRRIAVLTDRKDFSVMEVLDLDALGMEDRLLWDGEDPLGKVTVRNGARALDLQVKFLRHGVAAAGVGPALVAP